MTHQKLHGVYLVIDPAVEKSTLLEKVRQALEGGVQILQIWNNWPDEMHQPDKKQVVTYFTEMAAEYDVPVLINDEWDLLKTTPLDGVHFDATPEDFSRIKKEINRDFIAGITCGNDLDIVRWANKNGLDYISFCAMFPSPSVGSCEIVSPETVKEARKITDLPLFLSGGITPQKIEELDELEFNGVAVISGILNSEAPKEEALNYNQSLKS